MYLELSIWSNQLKGVRLILRLVLDTNSEHRSDTSSNESIITTDLSGNMIEDCNPYVDSSADLFTNYYPYS